MDNGKALNVISGLGYTFGAIKELQNQITTIKDQRLHIKNGESTQSGTVLDLSVLGKLEAQGAVTFKAPVEFLDVVIFKALARFKELFADKTHQKELCIGEETSETCITKDKLDELLKLLPSPTPTPTPTPTLTLTSPATVTPSVVPVIQSPTPTSEVTPTP